MGQSAANPKGLQNIALTAQLFHEWLLCSSGGRRRLGLGGIFKRRECRLGSCGRLESGIWSVLDVALGRYDHAFPPGPFVQVAHLSSTLLDEECVGTPRYFWARRPPGKGIIPGG